MSRKIRNSALASGSSSSSSSSSSYCGLDGKKEVIRVVLDVFLSFPFAFCFPPFFAFLSASVPKRRPAADMDTLQVSRQQYVGYGTPFSIDRGLAVPIPACLNIRWSSRTPESRSACCICFSMLSALRTTSPMYRGVILMNALPAEV